MQQKYDELCAMARKSNYLKSTLALLEWDQHTKLPHAGGPYRSEQITFLSGELHRHEVDSKRGELLGELADSDLAGDPHSDTGATIRELKRRYDKKVKLPQSLVESLAKASSVGQQVWIEARKADDFKKFEPNLAEIFQLKREEAQALGYQEHPYDALLDEYEPGASTAEVTAVLTALKDELVPLIAQVRNSSTNVQTDLLRRNYPVGKQEQFGRMASAAIGFEYDRGRLDVTHHPFCTEIGPEDVRLTTRYDDSFFSSSFFGTLHEAGHGIYEQGLRSEFYGLPPGEYCSLGIHESQSRMWENLVGRSPRFWDHFYGSAVEHFPDALSDVKQPDFVAAINAVAPSLIRVEADEATYNLHIIIRYELEQELISDSLAISDLPTAWNDRYEQYLGIRPESDANGVLQDVHWSAGLIGYFPTYALGNLYAAQFFDAAQEELGDLGQQFGKGKFNPLKTWLNKNVHAHGKCYNSRELAELLVGKPIHHEPLIRQLRHKLSSIYGL